MGPELGAPACASVSPICKMQIVQLRLTGAARSAGIPGRREAALFHSHPTQLSFSALFSGMLFIKVVIYSSPT